MTQKRATASDPVSRAMSGSLLAAEGIELADSLWERSVYLGPDGLVYHIAAVDRPGGIEKSIVGKRAVGEYLRWVDGLFRPGGIPGEENGIHYRAARKLRELI